MKFYKIVILVFSASLFSQSIDQIKQAKKFIKDKGLSIQDAKKIAKSKGYTDQQINEAVKKSQAFDQNQQSVLEGDDLNKNQEASRFVQENSDILQQESNFSSNNKSETSSEKTNKESLEIIDDDPLAIESSLSPTNAPLRYFGYDIFKRDPSLFQASSVGAVDPEYLIGPNDEIIFMLWGETQFRQVLTVDREGFIFIPDIGQVFVNGLNLKLLESKLFKVLSQYYSSLNPTGRKATTFLDVSLGNLRPLRIHVLGDVSQPGAYTVSPSTTLFSALYYFNGPTKLGSLRDIRLIRGREQITSIDFYDYLMTGKKPKDEKLQLDDVIFIPKRSVTVSINGEVNKPGIYELKDDESLKDIIDMSGGLKVTAYLKRAQIDRIVPFKDRDSLGMDRMFTDVDLLQALRSKNKVHLEDGDKIQVFSVLELRQNVVELSGSVSRPGSYDISDSLSLKDLIAKADGLLGDVYYDRIDVVRVKSDFKEELIKLNLKKVMEGVEGHDIKLKGLDRVRVYGFSEMVPKTFVSISGHVKRPGKYPLQENMTLYDLIFKSGGFMDEEFKKLTYLSRSDLVRETNNNQKEIIPFNLALVLENKDLAQIPMKVNDAVRIYSTAEILGAKRFVEISGYVKRPGKYELFEENMNLYDLLFQASGLDDPQFRAGAFLERADIFRYDKNRINKTLISFDLGNVLKDFNHVDNIKLEDGDELKIYPLDIFNLSKTVKIEGAIKNPGEYALKNNMTIKDLILQSGGLKDNVYRYKIEIARINPNDLNDEVFSKVIYLKKGDLFLSSDKNNFLSQNEGNDEFFLQSHDYVFVRPDPYFNMQKTVNVLGAVYYPGKYSILGPSDKLTDIISRAGGLRPSAHGIASQFTRNSKELNIDLKKIIKRPKSKQNVNVQDGDILFVPKKPDMVQVIGEVSVPGYYKFISGTRVNDIIRNAGGFSQNAEKNDVFIILPNGKSKKYNRFFRNSRVLDGSIITVGKKPEEEPFDGTEYAKEVTSIIANLTQAISIILIARN